MPVRSRTLEAEVNYRRTLYHCVSQAAVASTVGLVATTL